MFEITIKTDNLAELQRLMQFLGTTSIQVFQGKKIGGISNKKPVAEATPPSLVSETATVHEAVKPLRKTLTLNDLLTEQQFKGFDRQELDQLIAEINLTEPIEDLLAMLN